MITPLDILDRFGKTGTCGCADHLGNICTYWLEAYQDPQVVSFRKLRKINMSKLIREPFIPYILPYTKESLVYWLAILNTVLYMNETILYDLEKDFVYEVPTTSTRLLSNLINVSLLNYISINPSFCNYRYKINWRRILVKLYVVAEVNNTDYFTHEELSYILSKYIDGDLKVHIKYLIDLGFLRFYTPIKDRGAYYKIASMHLFRQFTLIKPWQLKKYIEQFNAG
jgi:hypothetical protein